MKVFMIGGTGLLGSEAAKILIERGHEVVSIALPPIPTGSNIPKEMKLELGNYMDLSDEELTAYFKNADAFVFAAGIDERVEGPYPVYDLFKKYNIDTVDRLLGLAKAAGVKHNVILGSYFSYFAKKWPELNLTKWHPYIRSRIDQETVALSYAEKGFDVAVLELPYIFGTQPGRKPVWLFLVEMIQNMKKKTMYPKGGTTMVTVKQVGQAVAGAVEKNEGGNAYPIGYYNMTWTEMLTVFHKYMGVPDKPIVTIPNCLYTLGGMQIKRNQKKHNIDGGLDMVKFTKLMCSNLFIDASEGCTFLGVTEDHIDEAIGDSVKLCLDILNKNVETVDMKAK